MTDNASRAAEAAPKILGVEMRQDGRGGWSADFGALTFSLEAAPGDGRFRVVVDYIGATSRMRQALGPFSLVNCARHIERELLAIRDAIPAKETDGG